MLQRLFTYYLALSFILFSSLFVSSPLIASLPVAVRDSAAQGALEIPLKIHPLASSTLPGKSFDLLIELKIPEGWHIYWKNPGDGGQPPTFHWTLPEGIKLQSTEWPVPEQFEVGALIGYGYKGDMSWRAHFTADSTISSGQHQIALKVLWIACDESCVPGESSATTEIVTSNTTPTNSSTILPDSILSNFPIPTDATVTLEENSIVISIPFQEPFISATFFPAKEGLFPTEQQPQWQKNETHLVGTLPIGETLKNKLLEEEKIEGVVKILTPQAWKGLVIEAPIKKSPLGFVSQAFDNRIEKMVEQQSGQNLLAIAILAFLGGIILNFMPCVLPVIGIKVLHISQMRVMGRWKTFQLGIFFTLGALLSFISLAAIIYGVQSSAGVALGWGFQLQEPLFVTALIIILFLFSLSLFSVFEVGTKAAAIAGTQESAGRLRLGKHSRLGAFLSGILTTIVASPCTGPLLGSALGFSATLEWHMGLLVFASLGLGMSFPFLLFSLFPELAVIFPKPGPWMNTFKQFLGFCMLGTVLWLLWVLTAQRPELTVTNLMGQLFLIATGAWIYGTWGTIERCRITRLFATIVAVLIVSFASFNLIQSVKKSPLPVLTESKDNWKPYSDELLLKLLSEKKSVLIDFTAKWCLTCQANKLVLNSTKIQKLLKQHEIVLLVADWTTNDEKITNALRKLGRNSVPVNALYLHGKAKPILLPELLTPQSIVDALEAGNSQ